MGILFQNGFAIGTTPGGGGNGVSPYWTDSVSGYTELTGGMTATDDGYSNNPIVLPYTFWQDGSGNTDLYVSTNGVVSLGMGYGNCCPYTPQDSNILFGGNPGDQMLDPGVGLGDGTTMGMWYKITDYGQDVFKVEIKVFNSVLGDTSTVQSYQINLYRDANYQYMESWVKINASTYGNGGRMGPYNSTDVTVPASKTRNTWRGDLNGQNWTSLGNVNVNISAPLTQLSNDGSSNNQGLILYLDGANATSGSTIFDQSGNGNDLTYSGSDPYVGSGYYDFNNGGSAYLPNNPMLNNLLNTISIQMWVNFPSTPTGQSLFSRTYGNNAGWAFRATSGQFNLVKYNVADQYSNGSFSLTSNTWYHIAVVQGGTSLMFMLNGVIVGSMSGANNNFANTLYPFTLCTDSYINSTLSLKIATFKMWDTFRTYSQILSDFNAEKSSFGY